MSILGKELIAHSVTMQDVREWELLLLFNSICFEIFGELLSLAGRKGKGARGSAMELLVEGGWKCGLGSSMGL